MIAAPRVPASEGGVVHHDDASVIPGGGLAEQLADDQSANPAKPPDGDPSGGERPKERSGRLSGAERVVEETTGHSPCRCGRERGSQRAAQPIVSNDETLYVGAVLRPLDARQHLVGKVPHVADYPHPRRWHGCGNVKHGKRAVSSAAQGRDRLFTGSELGLRCAVYLSTCCSVKPIGVPIFRP